MVTGRCNSRCKTCGIWSRESHAKEELTPEQIGQAVESIGKDVYWVGLSGGEPTLRDDFADIAKAIYHAAPNLIMLNFNTNGLQPDKTEQMVSEIASLPVPFIMAALSIDGIGEAHDKTRAIPGAFDKLMDTAERLYKLSKTRPNFSLSFQTTVSRFNRETVDIIPDYLKKRFPGSTYIATVAVESHQVGRGSTEGAFAAEAEMDVVRKLGKKSFTSNLMDTIPRAYIGLAPLFLQNGESPVQCVAGRDMILVDPRGQVFPCDFMDLNMGSLPAEDFRLDRLLKKPDVQAIIQSCTDCKKCFTPCQAYPSFFRSPITMLRGLIRSYL